MKNFVLLGHLWKRAIEFVNEASADRYIAKHCQGINYEKYSEEELSTRLAGCDTKYITYANEQDNARGVIVVREF
ncbi:MAG: hypothetical protein RLZZ422_2028 [Pseudomonadota bacterium]|jgi:hypothetical protein